MSASTKKKINLIQRVAVLFIYAMCACDTLIELTLADMSAAFPEAPPVMINMVSNFHILSVAVASIFIVPRLARRYDKKKLIMLAMLGYGVFGMMGAVFNGNIYIILIEQLLFGLGMAFASCIAVAFVDDLYEGRDRENMMGWLQTISSAVAVVITMIAGVLCAMHWTYTFWSYAIFVAAITLMYIGLPASPPRVEDVKTEAKGEKVVLYTDKQKIKLALVIVFTIFVLMGMVTLNIKLSIAVDERGLGTSVVTALAKSMNTAGTMVFSAVYGIVQRVTKRYVFHVGILTTAVGCFVAAFAFTPALIILGMFLAGGGMGFTAPAIYSKVASIGNPAAIPLGAGIIGTCFSIGMFLSSFFEVVVGLFVEATTTNILLAAGILFVGLAVIVLIYFIINPLKGTDYASQHQTSN